MKIFYLLPLGRSVDGSVTGGCVVISSAVAVEKIVPVKSVL